MAPCYSPVDGYRQRDGTISPSRRNAISFVICKRECGYCPGCRARYVRDWAMRAQCEASLYDFGLNCIFLTLTYNPESLPEYGFLDYSHPRNFMTRLRRYFGPGIRSFGVAEYGTKGRRPHYHICIFNFNLPLMCDATDEQIKSGCYKSYYGSTSRGDLLYTSPVIERLWSHPKTKKSRGFHLIGSLTYESAAYCAMYMHKKVKGNKSAIEDRYTHVDLDTGECISIPRERSICVSLKPGIGAPWLEKFKLDCYPSDEFVTGKGFKIKPPRYYDKLFEKWHPKEMAEIKLTRESKARKDKVNSTPERLQVREKVFVSKLKRMKRGFESGS